MTPAPDLTVIIPVHNAAETVGDVVRSFVALASISTEIILVDDCSTDDSPAVLTELAEQHDQVQIKSHRVNRGAGVARNTGFASATGRYTIFFDADDLVHGDAVEAVIPVLDESGASIAVMPYHYQRKEGQHVDMNDADVTIFREYLGSQLQRIGRLDDMPRLLSISNYPWNRILRTEAYRQAGLRYGSTPVNNDILGHWYSLLFADRVVMFNQEICTHIVREGGTNLTNQQSAVRLTLFDALDETYDLLEQFPHLRNRYSHHYWASVIRIGSWGQARIGTEHAEKFALRFQQHLLRINLADFSRIRLKRDPSLAAAIVRRSLA